MKLAKIHPKRKFYTSLYDEYLRDELVKKEIKLHIINNKPPMMGSKKAELTYNADEDNNNIVDAMEVNEDNDGEDIQPPVIPPPPPPPPAGGNGENRTLQDTGVVLDRPIGWPPYCPATAGALDQENHFQQVHDALNVVRSANNLPHLRKSNYADYVVWEYIRIIHEHQQSIAGNLYDTNIFLKEGGITQTKWVTITGNERVFGYTIPAGSTQLEINLAQIKRRLRVTVGGGVIFSYASRQKLAPNIIYQRLLALLDTPNGSQDLKAVYNSTNTVMSYMWKYMPVNNPYIVYAWFIGRSNPNYSLPRGITPGNLYIGACIPPPVDPDETARRLTFSTENPDLDFPLNCPAIVDYNHLNLVFASALDIINAERLALDYEPLQWSDTLTYAAHLTNLYGKDNDMYLDADVGRTYSYNRNETIRSSRRIDEGGEWVVSLEAEYSAQRIFDVGFQELEPNDLSEREVPVVFELSDTVDPHIYVVDLLSNLIVGEKPYLLETATHIGFDYVMQYGPTSYIWMNIAVGKGQDFGFGPPLNTVCFQPYVPPVQRRLWQDDNIGEVFPLLCPEYPTYTYMEDIFSSSLDIINEARDILSLPPLQWSSRLSWLAEKTNVFAKNNNLEWPVAENRPISYNVTSLARISDRVDSNGQFWIRGFDLTTSLERQIAFGFQHDINTPDLGDREIPVAYVVSDISLVDPHVYVYDSIDGYNSHISSVWQRAEATHIGFNYIIKKDGANIVVYFNMVFGSGSDPVWIEELSREPCNRILDPPVYPDIPPYDINANYNFPLFCSALRTYENLPLTFTTSLQLINEKRGSLQLAPLVWSNKLAYVADLTLTYGRENAMFLQVDPTRRFSFAPNSIDRRSLRVDEINAVGGWVRGTDAATSLERITAAGFLDTGAIPPYFDREVPVVYGSDSLNLNPHQYIYDVLREQISYVSPAYLDPNATHIGMNYQLNQFQRWRYWFNMVIGSGTDPGGADPPGITFCFPNGGEAPPQDVDPAYANPTTKPCPVWPNVPEWPIVCPTPYTYEAMAAIAAPIIAEMNGYRSYRGLQPLIWNKNLTWAAQIYATYKHYDPTGAPAHMTPNSPYGAGLGERVAASNFIGPVQDLAEGASNIAGNGGLANPLSVWCMFKGEYNGEGVDNGHFNPFSIPGPDREPSVRNFNAVGIGWTVKDDNPLPGWKNVAFTYVYGNMTTDNAVNAPPLEDPLILCTDEMPDIGDIKSSLLTINHNGWYNLNGQQIDENTRPFAAQNASTIFGGTFLPDLSDAVLSQQTLKTISGTNDVNVLIDNLPNLSLSGVTAPFSDVVSTDLNGSGLQPLINGATTTDNISGTTSFGGGLNTTLPGATTPFTDSIVSTFNGEVNQILNGTTSTFSTLVSTTTQGVIPLSGTSGNVGPVIATGSTTSTGAHQHGFLVFQGNDANGPPNYNMGTDDQFGSLTHTTNPGDGQHNHNVSVTVPSHSHSIDLNIPAHSHDVDINIPSLNTTSNLNISSHAHTIDINLPALDVSTPFNMSGHTHNIDISIPSLLVTGDVNIPNHAHALDIEIPTLAVTVPLNGLQQPLNVKGKRFGVNFFIYLGIG